jgi:hypothetical protein
VSLVKSRLSYGTLLFVSGRSHDSFPGILPFCSVDRVAYVLSARRAGVLGGFLLWKPKLAELCLICFQFSDEMNLSGDDRSL